MYTVSETADWTDTFDFSQNNGGYIQPGYSVSGTVGGSDTGDYIRTSMAVGQPYTFVLSGEGVSFEMLDDGNPVAAQISGNTLTYATTHPSDFADIRVSGNGSYTVTMVGIAADYLPDEDGGNMAGAPDLEIGTSITGVINGSGGTRETDYYAIQVEVGQTYNFAMTQVDSPYGATSGAELQILDDAGEAITSGGSWSSSAWADGATYAFTPSIAGTYYLTADTYFGSFGAYTLTASIGDAPTTIANVESITAIGSSGTTTVNVRISLDAAATEGISGSVKLTAADADYSRAATAIDTEFTIEAGATYIDVAIPAGVYATYSEDTVFVASLSEVANAKIGKGFLASETFNNGINTATEGDDTLTGSLGHDDINALGGDDRILGLEGDDTLNAGEGDDFVVGGEGADDINAGAGSDHIWAGDGDLGNDTIDGGEGHDIMGGGAGDDSLVGGEGNDTAFGGSGADTLDLGTGQDVAWAGDGNDSLSGGDDDDIFGGGTGNDTLSGDLGNDTIYAFSGYDEVFGGDGGDFIYAGTDNDTIYGGEGNDQMFGGDGDDIYVIGLNHGQDSIGGFLTKGNDVINLDLLPVSNFSQLTISQSGADALVGTGSGTILLWNTEASDIDAGHFIF